MADAGHFFISLGLNGAEKTLSGLSQVNDQFGGLKTISTEAKLAILAALAGLEQMVSVGGKFGAQMEQTHQHLNVAIRDLQLYEAAAQKFNAPKGMVTSALEDIQKTMTLVQFGKAPPDFYPTILSLFQQAGKKVPSADYFAKKPLEFFKDVLDIDKNSKVDKTKLYTMLTEANFPGELLDINKMGGFGQSNLKSVENKVLTDSQIEKLSKTNQTFEDAALNFEAAMANLTASPTILSLVKALDRFSDVTNKFILWEEASHGVDRVDKKMGELLLGKDSNKLLKMTGPQVVHFIEMQLKITNSDVAKAANAAANGAKDGMKRAGFSVTTGKFSSTVTQ